MPEVIALNYVFIVLNFPAKLCVFAFQIRCAEFAANGFVLRKFLLQTGDLCLEFCNQPVFAGVEPRKKLENAPVFVEQAEMEAI